MSSADPAGAESAAVRPAGAESAAALSARAWLTHLDIERGLSRHTLAAYRRDIARYLDFLRRRGVEDLSQVGSELVGDFLAALRAGDETHPALAASSAARSLIAVRSLHAFVARDGGLDSDPARSVQPPRPALRLPKAIPLDQVEALLAASGVGRTPAALRDRAILEVLYGVGARVSEVVGLDVDDLDREGQIVRLRGKGDKERIVPLGSYAAEALDAYRTRARPVLAGKGSGSPALFLNQRGGRLTRQGVWGVLKGAAERAGLGEAISPHTLRHSFATHLLQGGADVRIVQELLGHASVTTTQIYTKVTIAQLREVYAGSHPRAR